MDLKRLPGFFATKNWVVLSEWLLAMISSLHLAGVEEETCKQAWGMGLKNIGLMGAKLIMGSEFYKTPYISKGMSIIVPTEKEQQVIQDRVIPCSQYPFSM